MDKLIDIALAPMAMFRGIVSAAELYVSESGWRRDGSAFDTDDAPTQAGVDKADTGEMIFVWYGSCTGNMDVNRRLTLNGGGTEMVAVRTTDIWDRVFNVAADYGDIRGFTATVATGKWRVMV